MDGHRRDREVAELVLEQAVRLEIGKHMEAESPADAARQSPGHLRSHPCGRRRPAGGGRDAQRDVEGRIGTVGFGQYVGEAQQRDPDHRLQVSFPWHGAQRPVRLDQIQPEDIAGTKLLVNPFGDERPHLPGYFEDGTSRPLGLGIPEGRQPVGLVADGHLLAVDVEDELEMGGRAPGKVCCRDLDNG